MYPTIPVLIGYFDNPTSYTVEKTINQYSPGQYPASSVDALNPVSHIRSIKCVIEDYDNVLILKNFLKERSGCKPFYYSPFLDQTENGTLYICKDYEFRRISDNLWSFSAKFEQVYRMRT